MQNLWLQRDKAESVRDLFFSLLPFEDDAEERDFSDLGIEKNLYLKGIQFYCDITAGFDFDTLICGEDFLNLLELTGLLTKQDDRFITHPDSIDYISYHGTINESITADVYTVDPYSEIVHLGSVGDTKPKFWSYVRVSNIPDVYRRKN